MLLKSFHFNFHNNQSNCSVNVDNFHSSMFLLRLYWHYQKIIYIFLSQIPAFSNTNSGSIFCYTWNVKKYHYKPLIKTHITYTTKQEYVPTPTLLTSTNMTMIYKLTTACLHNCNVGMWLFRIVCTPSLISIQSLCVRVGNYCLWATYTFHVYISPYPCL